MKKAFWEKRYQNDSLPFDSDPPDDWIVSLAKQNKITGNVLDAGCGTGRNALYLAGLGFGVLGIDVIPEAIERAKIKAAQANSFAVFEAADICTYNDHVNYFDTIIDIGCFHSLPKDDHYSYVQALDRLGNHSAIIYLRAFSDADPRCDVPGISEDRIRTVFESFGWNINKLDHARVDLQFMVGKTYAWFAELKRNE